MKITLKLASLYNLCWGSWVIIRPNQFFMVVGMEPLNHPMVWQGMGMVIGIYGIGYWIASNDPIRHWPIVLVGLLGKLFGPIGFFMNYFQENVPFAFFYALVTNDFIWWIPFFYILKITYQKTH